MAASIYDISCLLITGQQLPLASLRGQVLLVVNTASNCGFTQQYAALEALYREYRPQGFTVLAFPSNDFRQEPESEERIHEFCLRSYDVTFPLASKSRVNGPDQHPLFRLLKETTPGFRFSRAIKWNFTKFLVDRDGQGVARFGPMTVPDRLRAAIAELLAAPPRERASTAC